ncbi:uncharacterized protein LOC129952415 [Eupeodes corollae]|uniref:uncharacterized protein LOC129952415 n=1 Tax=Eupeodes corollae TaxID=290404 RepID=UPI0024930E11|nr:uncharacterized protein LOC129952415 [Eupeodes corollae]
MPKYQNLSNVYFSKVNGKYHHPFNALRRNSKYGHAVFPRSSSNFEPEMFDVPKKSPLRKALDYLIGPNGRCNILKPIICKSKTMLLPPGYSMVQDIVRIFILSLTKDLSPKGEDFNYCEDKLFPDCII